MSKSKCLNIDLGKKGCVFWEVFPYKIKKHSTRPSVMEVSPWTFGLSKTILPIDHRIVGDHRIAEDHRIAGDHLIAGIIE